MATHVGEHKLLEKLRRARVGLARGRVELAQQVQPVGQLLLALLDELLVERAQELLGRQRRAAVALGGQLFCTHNRYGK
jgi:hypothetical protein